MTTATKKRGRPKKQPSQAAEDQGLTLDEWQAKKESNGASEARTEQTYIEGTEPVSIPEIDSAAEEFVKIRNRWQAQGEEMQAANKLLLELMKKHGLEQYKFDSQLVKVEKASEKVRVNRVKEKPVKDD